MLVTRVLYNYFKWKKHSKLNNKNKNNNNNGI